ncbi:reverse transcriptase [Phytophthora megakarya]|uniref:Reverse transcriptase n=1 Tax=Phytophthora megakarya TaxID=4795 RepID=A0A225VZL8_9STRA|nr:reverse transcriptase [Phytophthora megakarya]
MGADNIRWTRQDEMYIDHGDEVLILHQDQRIGIWLAGDHVPRIPGFISIGSRRYMEWQNLALEATTDTRSEGMEVEVPLVPAVKQPEYETPGAILQRPKATLIKSRKVEAGQDQDIPDCLSTDKSPSDKLPSEIRPLDLVSVASEASDLSSIAGEDPISHAVTAKEALDVLDQVTSDDQLHSRGQDQGISPSKCGGSDPPSMMSVQSGTGPVTSDPLNDKYAASMPQKTDMDPSPINKARRIWTSPGTQIQNMMNVYTTMKEVIYVDGQMAARPEVPVTTEDVKIEDHQLCGSDNQTPEIIDRLRQRIWKFRHLLIGKGNAFPPAARGVMCDIDVGGARPIALKCRKLQIQFREILADLIKGLLSAKMINYSRSPWASPTVVIIKKNGVDIRLCIDYRLVNCLTQLMIYLMPLINDLLEDLESTLWYCSLDMASGFWVGKMTDRARLISAFITPFGLFEWNRMTFGLTNAH